MLHDKHGSLASAIRRVARSAVRFTGFQETPVAVFPPHALDDVSVFHGHAAVHQDHAIADAKFARVQFEPVGDLSGEPVHGAFDGHDGATV